LSPLQTERTFLNLLRLCAAFSAVIVIFIVGFVASEAWPALREIGWGRFFSDTAWHPDEGEFGLAPMLTGTLLVTLGAVLLAAPLGVAVAVTGRTLASPLAATILRRAVELLAGIPSVVFGFWGLVVVVPLIAQLAPPGPSLLAGVIILGLMITPTVALLTDAALAGVADDHRRSAAALGLSRTSAMRRVLVPAARSGIFSGIFLATARALGETMAMLMVCGNVVQTPQSLFDPLRTLTANMALEMAYAMDTHRAALFVSGLMLFGLVALVVAGAAIFSSRRARTHHG
jgi:phosphate transport system permease protein